MSVELLGVPVGALPYLQMGFGNTQWNGNPLPLSLAGLGLPGCDLLVDVAGAFPMTTAGTAAQWSTMIPGTAGLIGTAFYLQGGILAAGGSGVGGVALSQGLAGLVGAR